jgi:hypothetical protein
MEATHKDLLSQNKVFLWIAMATGLILSLPLIAMQFTSEVNWGAEDLIAMGILLFGMGTVYVSIARVVPGKYQALVAASCTALLLLLWAHLAVGIVDSWPLAGY